MDITSMTAVEIGKKIKAKEITVADAVEAAIAQIERVEENVHSFVRIDKEGARKRAEEVQKMINDGTLTGPLAGVPVAIKDNLCTKGVETTCSSKILEGFKPTFTAEAVVNLEKAGAVILGKTNMDEFAKFFLWSCWNQANLWNGIPLWTDRIWLFAGSDRTDRKRCHRLCDNSGDHCLS